VRELAVFGTNQVEFAHWHWGNASEVSKPDPNPDPNVDPNPDPNVDLNPDPNPDPNPNRIADW